MTLEKTEDWQRLGQAVVARRVELGMKTRQSFAAAAFMSERVLAEIEKARRSNYDPATIARLEQALRWPFGTARSIVAGDAEPPSGPPPSPRVNTGNALDRLAALLDPRGPLDLQARTALETALEALASLAEAQASPEICRP
ncbi:hypothetical protein [Dactylosporangium sp. CA-139066]|uniref:hypothetical protein n=1 Tax=Dactylosporangium sp. CA-139066 TaxID=3239930 RepID=UPI003D926BBB